MQIEYIGASGYDIGCAQGGEQDGVEESRRRKEEQEAAQREEEEHRES
jgi:hypothetical protein